MSFKVITVEKEQGGERREGKGTGKEKGRE